MKLYHIDRQGHLKANQTIELIKNFYNETTDNGYFQEGLSSHGIYYYLNDINNYNFALDVIFEYERMMYFPDKLSRYQSLYAFELEGVIDFVKKKNLTDNFFKIYEVNPEYYEKHNMNLIRGWSHAVISKNAKLYWSDSEDLDKERKLIYEYLIKFPVKLGKEVSYNELLKEYQKNNPSKEGETDEKR